MSVSCVRWNTRVAVRTCNHCCFQCCWNPFAASVNCPCSTCWFTLICISVSSWVVDFILHCESLLWSVFRAGQGQLDEGCRRHQVHLCLRWCRYLQAISCNSSAPRTCFCISAIPLQYHCNCSSLLCMYVVQLLFTLKTYQWNLSRIQVLKAWGAPRCMFAEVTRLLPFPQRVCISDHTQHVWMRRWNMFVYWSQVSTTSAIKQTNAQSVQVNKNS